MQSAKPSDESPDVVKDSGAEDALAEFEVAADADLTSDPAPSPDASQASTSADPDEEEQQDEEDRLKAYYVAATPKNTAPSDLEETEIDHELAQSDVPVAHTPVEGSDLLPDEGEGVPGGDDSTPPYPFADDSAPSVEPQQHPDQSENPQASTEASWEAMIPEEVLEAAENADDEPKKGRWRMPKGIKPIPLALGGFAALIAISAAVVLMKDDGNSHDDLMRLAGASEGYQSPAQETSLRAEDGHVEVDQEVIVLDAAPAEVEASEAADIEDLVALAGDEAVEISSADASHDAPASGDEGEAVEQLEEEADTGDAAQAETDSAELDTDAGDTLQVASAAPYPAIPAFLAEPPKAGAPVQPVPAAKSGAQRNKVREFENKVKSAASAPEPQEQEPEIVEQVRRVYTLRPDEIGLTAFNQDHLVLKGQHRNMKYGVSDVLPGGERIVRLDPASMTIVTDRSVVRIVLR